MVLLGAAAFYLAFVAEKPPALPKAAKPKKTKKKRGKAVEDSSDQIPAAETDDSANEAPNADAETETGPEIEAVDSADQDAATHAEADDSASAEASDAAQDEAQGTLRNKRPSGKSGHRLRRSARAGTATDTG